MPDKDIRAKNITDEDREWIARHEGELSDTTVKYAKWIHNDRDRPDRDGQSLATRERDVIRAWAEERGAKPATVHGNDEVRVLRMNFPGYGGDNLREITWDEWFDTFEDRDLVFLYQERKSNGDQSNFFRLDSPEREDG